ncbi:site-2 protease family protein [Actinoallomurus iriomotensis]|uniref:Zinc metalloprotease n=1 Tax=Actinoallomurus iriomotensis TaxID=478107 RepID=A0A9W6RHF7_9ACTN|nr:site-2 protease family protein [Actinoallomurus iriomotensis]GLY76091.1 zinc metalloprotease [Actinoallomurus iriomotensis]
MNDTFRLGRIVGVRVGVNWTVLVVFTLLAYGLAADRLPQSYKGLHPVVYVLGGLVTAAAFMASLLAHELAHAVVARRNGLTVDGITLWLLGGVARFEGEPDSPGAELRIAGAGPLVSLLLGVVLAAGSAVLLLAGVEGLVAGCLAWLAAINVVLALFNVIPAAPLDGGRLVHALLWRLSGDRTKATLHAAQTGRGFGWAAMVAGFYVSLWTFSGLWLIVIGWFLIAAAGMEAGQARVIARLEGITIGRIMTPDPFTVSGSMTAAEFSREMLPRHRHTAYPLVDEGVVRGIVTAERIGEQDPSAPVGAVVEEAGRTAAQTSLAELLPRLARERLLVFDGERLVGIVTPRDLTRALERLPAS